MGGFSNGLTLTGGNTILSGNTVKGGSSGYESKATQTQQENISDRTGSSTSASANQGNVILQPSSFNSNAGGSSSLLSSNINSNSQSKLSESGITASVDSSLLKNNNDKYAAGSSESINAQTTGTLYGNKQNFGSEAASASGSSLYKGTANLGGSTSFGSGSLLNTDTKAAGSSSYNSNNNAGATSSSNTGNANFGGSTSFGSGSLLNTGTKAAGLSSYNINNNAGRASSSYGSVTTKFINSAVNSQGGNHGTSGAYLITGPPFGIKTMVEFTEYNPENLNLSRCGPRKHF